MATKLGTHGQTRARGPAPALLTILLVAAVAGCGTQQTAQAPAGSKSEEATGATGGTGATVVATAHGTATHAAGSAHAGAIHRITISDRRCIDFEPQWTSLRVGQSVVWRSELKKPVTIYVSPGVFDRISFTVRPGATVSTGPARSVGRYSFWTEPSACRDAPRGVLMAGPGVRVQETYYASTGPR